MSFGEIILSIIIGLITGYVSGWIVYVLTKRKEEKTRQYYYCRDYIWESLKHCDMYMPVKMICDMEIFKEDKEFAKAIQEIHNIMHPESTDNRKMTNDENKLLENFRIANERLKTWKEKNKIK